MFSRSLLSRGRNAAAHHCTLLASHSPRLPQLAHHCIATTSTNPPIQEFPPIHSNTHLDTRTSSPISSSGTTTSHPTLGTPPTLSRSPYPSSSPQPPAQTTSSRFLTPAPQPPPNSPLPPTLLPHLPPLLTQPPHYLTLHIHGRPYLLTEGDVLRLPFRMPHVVPGDTLRLTTASSIGSRDYTLRGDPWVDPRLFEARAVVLGVEAEPMRVMEKSKRRNRKVKRVRSKHRFTEIVLRRGRVRGWEELVGMGILGGEGKEIGGEGSGSEGRGLIEGQAEGQAEEGSGGEGTVEKGVREAE